MTITAGEEAAKIILERERVLELERMRSRLPEWALESLKEYVRVGHPTGGFLEALLSNDLMDSFGRADEGNIILMFQYAKYVYNKMPNSCHGSREIYQGWVSSGGLEGQTKEGE